MSETSRNALRLPNLHLEILHLTKIPNHQTSDIEDLQTLDSNNNQMKTSLPKIINIKSPIKKHKKNLSNLNLEERIKVKPKIKMKRNKTIERKSIIPPIIEKKNRFDIYGTEISKRKRQKISFRDEIDSNKPIADVIDIQSYKEYLNYQCDSNGEGKVKSTCCCIII